LNPTARIILSGDFYQLPPSGDKKYAFTTDAWKSLKLECLLLTKIERQKDDLAYGKILSSMRSMIFYIYFILSIIDIGCRTQNDSARYRSVVFPSRS
jgi:hypothetical protein